MPSLRSSRAARSTLLGVYAPPEELFVSGRGSWLVDDAGKRYLDFTAGIAVNALGYDSPVIRGAVEEALETGLVHTSNLFRTEPAEALVDVRDVSVLFDGQTILDRIDLRMSLPRLTEDELIAAPAGERSDSVKQRVTLARDVMLARQGCVNADLHGALLNEHATPEPSAEPVLRALVTRLHLSGRGFDRVLRVARTVADLAGSPTILATHLSEAAAYRGQ